MGINLIIIGAGLAGLTAARALQQKGHTVTVLDKGRGVGGRLATRRLGTDTGRADHGAQYFSARSPAFGALAEELLAKGLVREWHLEQSDPASFQHPRYVVAGGMSQLAKHLAEGLDIRTDERVISLRQGKHSLNRTDAGWQVRCESGLTLDADALLITIPAPQALALLDDSGVSLPDGAWQALAAIQYEPCLAVMLQLSQPSSIPAPGGLKLTDSPVAWLADNQQKGVSEGVPSVTIHASHSYSRQHLDDTDLAALLPELLAAVANYVPAGSIVDQRIHRWRYSNATQRHPEPVLTVEVENAGTLLFGGDGFGSGNVEGAFLSGLALAEAVSELS